MLPSLQIQIGKLRSFPKNPLLALLQTSASIIPVAVTCKVNDGGSSKPSLPFVPQMENTGSPTLSAAPIPNAVSSVDKTTTSKARSALTATAGAAKSLSHVPTSTTLFTAAAVKPVTSVLTPIKPLQPLPKSQSLRNASFNRTTSPINDFISDLPYMRGNEKEAPTISGIVWEHCCGHGKLSAKYAWEKRRSILSRSNIMYYNTLAKVAAKESEQQDSHQSVATTGSIDALDSKPKL